jgi:hypothetical protein
VTILAILMIDRLATLHLRFREGRRPLLSPLRVRLQVRGRDEREPCGGKEGHSKRALHDETYCSGLKRGHLTRRFGVLNIAPYGPNCHRSGGTIAQSFQLHKDE